MSWFGYSSCFCYTGVACVDDAYCPHVPSTCRGVCIPGHKNPDLGIILELCALTFWLGIVPVVVLCCCGSAEQQQKQQNAQSIERAEVVLWLQSINLDEYRHSIIDYGYDSMTALDHADEDEILAMTEDASVSMKKPHRVVFIREWNARPKAAAAPPAPPAATPPPAPSPAVIFHCLRPSGNHGPLATSSAVKLPDASTFDKEVAKEERACNHQMHDKEEPEADTDADSDAEGEGFWSV
jgi:hypothetical protein